MIQGGITIFYQPSYYGTFTTYKYLDYSINKFTWSSLLNYCLPDSVIVAITEIGEI